MNDDERRAIAGKVILCHGVEPESDQIEDEITGSNHAMQAPVADLEAIEDLIQTAIVTITWPDPCPACGALGCTEHPTWAAEPKARNLTQPYNIEPELPEWERELLARQAIDAPNLYVNTVDLTPAQEIRLRIVESLTCPEADEPDTILDIAERLAEWVETGERGDEQDDQELAPARYPMDTAALQKWGEAVTRKINEAFAPPGVKVTLTPVEPYIHEAVKEFAEQTGRAGYSETLRIPGTDDAVVLTPGGFERVVTAQDPGGLLSEPPVAPLPVVTPNDPPRSGDDSA